MRADAVAFIDLINLYCCVLCVQLYTVQLYMFLRCLHLATTKLTYCIRIVLNVYCGCDERLNIVHLEPTIRTVIITT